MRVVVMRGGRRLSGNACARAQPAVIMRAWAAACAPDPTHCMEIGNNIDLYESQKGRSFEYLELVSGF